MEPASGPSAIALGVYGPTVARHPVRRREREQLLAAAVGRVGTAARQPHAGALGHPTQLVRQQRRVGRDDDHARSFVVLLGHVGGELLADPDPVDQEVLAVAVVRHHQHADGVATLGLRG